MTIIHYISILITTAIAMILGMGWFGPLFGKLWAELVGMKPRSDMSAEENREFQKKMTPVYITNLVLTALMMTGLFFFVNTFSKYSGLTASFLAWLFFVLPIVGTAALWNGKTKDQAWKIFLLTAVYNLICFLVAGAIYTQM